MLVVYTGFPTALSALGVLSDVRAKYEPAELMAAPVAVEPDFADRLARAAGPGVTVRSVEVMPGGHSGPDAPRDAGWRRGPRGRRRQVDAAGPRAARTARRAAPGPDHARARSARRRARAAGPVRVLRRSRRSSPRPASPGEAVDPAIAEDSVERPAALVAARWERAIADPGRPARAPTRPRSRVSGEPAREPARGARDLVRDDGGRPDGRRPGVRSPARGDAGRRPRVRPRRRRPRRLSPREHPVRRSRARAG